MLQRVCIFTLEPEGVLLRVCIFSLDPKGVLLRVCTLLRIWLTASRRSFLSLTVASAAAASSSAFKSHMPCQHQLHIVLQHYATHYVTHYGLCYYPPYVTNTYVTNTQYFTHYISIMLHITHYAVST